jgi:hypothetical protein
VGGTLFSLKRKGLKGVKTTGTRNSLKAGTRDMSPSAEGDLFDLSGVAVSSLEFSSVEVEGVKALGGDCSREDGSDRTEALEAERVASESIGDSSSSTLDKSSVSWRGRVKSQLSFGASSAS